MPGSLAEGMSPHRRKAAPGLSRQLLRSKVFLLLDLDFEDNPVTIGRPVWMEMDIRNNGCELSRFGPVAAFDPDPVFGTRPGGSLIHDESLRQ